MARFDYLDGKKGKTKPKKVKASAPAPVSPTERLEPVYLRKETIRAVWREVKRDGGESVSELVEDLLLRWLRERTR